MARIATITAVGIGLAAIIYGVRQVAQPRGIRNNNPGNIKRSNTAWEGLADVQDDETFFTFKTPEYGIRAMARILRTYRSKHLLLSVDQIINRWAPLTENPTLEYVALVSERLGVRPWEQLSFHDEQVAELIEAIIRMENGVEPYDRATILRGIEMERL